MSARQRRPFPIREKFGLGAKILAIVLPMALAVAVGLPGISGTFVRDDWIFVPLNPVVAGDASIPKVFASPFDVEHATRLYRPLTALSLLANWRAAGEAPWAYHATNLAISACCAGLLAWLLLGFGLSPLVAGLGAALLAVHPARSESVVWIAGRAELLMAAFALLALVIAQRASGFLRWPLCALAAVASAFSKEQGFVLVALVPLLPGLSRGARVTGAIVLACALGAAFAWRWIVVGTLGPEGAMQVLPNASAFDLVTFGLHHLGGYVRLLFWPRPLLNEYDDPVLPVGPVWVSVGIVALVLPGLLFLLRRPRAAFAAALFVVPLLPVLNVFYRTGETFAERFLCLPLAGFAAIVALACAGLPERARGLGASLLGAVIVVFGALFWVRAGDWTSQRALVEAQLRDAPDVGGSWQIVAADILDELGVGEPPKPDDVARAGVLLTRALEIAPHRAGAAVSLAKVHLRAAHGMRPGDPTRDARLREAERLLRSALAVDPELSQTRGILGVVLVDLGRREEAEAELRTELRKNPEEYRAASNLAALLDETNRPEEARKVREDARAAALRNAETHPGRSGPLSIAASFALALGRTDDARALVTLALEIEGEGPETRAKTAIEASHIYGALSRPTEARSVLEKMRADLARDSDGSAARALALAGLDQALGEAGRARAVLEAALKDARGLSRRRLEAALSSLR